MGNIVDIVDNLGMNRKMNYMVENQCKLFLDPLQLNFRNKN